MADDTTMAGRWRDYRPSKALWFWTTAGAVSGTMILGFTWGGWTTGSGARSMATSAAEEARESLAAAVCVERFMAAGDAAAQLAALQAVESSWQRDDFIEEGGWAAFDTGGAMTGVADLCAERLMEVEAPTQEASGVSDRATVAQ